MASEQKYKTCPHCNSENLIRQTGNDESTCHYGRLSCGDCGKFITWLRDPSTSISHHNRQKFINNHITHQDLTDWDREFLSNIYAQRVLSAKQQQCYERIFKKINNPIYKSGIVSRC